MQKKGSLGTSKWSNFDEIHMVKPREIQMVKLGEIGVVKLGEILHMNEMQIDDPYLNAIKFGEELE